MTKRVDYDLDTGEEVYRTHHWLYPVNQPPKSLLWVQDGSTVVYVYRYTDLTRRTYTRLALFTEVSR